MPPQAVFPKGFSSRAGGIVANSATASLSKLARSPELQEATGWFRQQRQWINEQQLALCRIAAPTFFEAKRAAWMRDQFARLGWDSRIDRAGNVIATRPDAAGRPAIAVTAHLDTVLAPRTPEEISVGSEGQFFGPGVSDNGAGLAGLLSLAAVWNSVESFSQAFEDAPFTPVLVANVGEEGEGNLSGMRYLCRTEAKGDAAKVPAAFLVLDGPGHEHITSRALASRRFEVSIEGPGGHSWSDHGTGNPVHALGRTVTLFTDEIAELRPVTPLKSSYNFGLMQGGSSINSIPVGAWAKVDLRSEDMARMNAMAGLLQDSLERAVGMENARVASPNLRVTARIKEIGSRPGGELPENAPLLDAIRAVDDRLGIKDYLDCSSTDANIPLSLGLAAITIGAGGKGGGAHTPGEWFHPDGRELGLQRILLTLCTMLRGK